MRTQGVGPESHGKGSGSGRQQMTHGNEEVCSQPGGPFQVAAELSLEFFPWGASAFCEEGSRILLYPHGASGEGWPLQGPRGGRPESAADTETSPEPESSHA